MRYLILSDIHSNEEALTAVLSRMRRKRYDRVVILGELVGYVERVAELPPDRISHFFAKGMLMNVLAAMDYSITDAPRALRSRRYSADTTCRAMPYSHAAGSPRSGR